MANIEISSHVFKKHLGCPGKGASVFTDRHTLMVCIDQCLDTPNYIRECMGDKFVYQKSFPNTVGFLDIDKPAKKCRVIFNPRINFVISAYSIA